MFGIEEVYKGEEVTKKGSLYRKYIEPKIKEYKEEKKEQKNLKKIYETRKKFVLQRERRKLAHQKAERDAKRIAKEMLKPKKSRKVEIIKKMTKNLSKADLVGKPRTKKMKKSDFFDL